jgi:hypothetical protein
MRFIRSDLEIKRQIILTEVAEVDKIDRVGEYEQPFRPALDPGPHP